MTQAISEKSGHSDTSGKPGPYLCKPADRPGPFVFALPHSGRFYPPSMRARTHLPDHTLRMSEDAFVDRLFADIPQYGATLLVATHARAYLDLNRATNELDPGLFEPALADAEIHETHRVKAGLGIIPRLVAENIPIYDHPLPAREAENRIRQIYRPYHEKLESLIRTREAQFGYAVLVDCHSMPSERSGRGGRHHGPDIVLGDNWGSACARDLTSLAEEFFLGAGFTVRRNVPYSGGFTTRHYGNPDTGIHALQIEINRAIYMNEQTLEPHPCFDDVKNKLQETAAALIRRFSAIQEKRGGADRPRAAE